MKKLFTMVAATILVVGMIPTHGQEEVLLRIGMLGEPKTLNIWKATDVWSVHVLGWFYPSLYYRKPVTLEPLPDLCTIALDELYANSPDGLLFTFPLRDDVLWDDGEPVTAYDFELYYVIITELEIPDYILVYKDVEYIRAVDDYTLEIKLKKCSPQFEEALIFHSAVPIQQIAPLLDEVRGKDVPMEAILDMPVENPISCGPFSFGEWEKGSFVKLVTNPNYYGKGRTVDVPGVGEITEGPYYDGLLLKLYNTIDAALLGIQKGEIDYIWWDLDLGYIAQLLGNPYISILKADALGFYYLAPNISREPFNDLTLRQALVYLVDKKFIVSRVLQGYGGAAHSVVMPAAGDWYCETNKFGSGMSKDERVAKATEILIAAGYTVPEEKYPDGVVLLPDGTPMQPFEILTPPADYDPMRAMAGVLIQEWWREIGAPVTAKPTSFSEINHETFESMTFDWYIEGWKIDGYGYPDYMYYIFHSDQTISDWRNLMGYKNLQTDKYLEDLMTLCDRDKLIYASCEAQKLIIEEVAYCPLYYRTLNEAHRNDTFAGWFTQLGGIVSTESPRSCLLYLKPIAEPPGVPPEDWEILAREYEAEAQEYQDNFDWGNAAENWENAARVWKVAADAYGNPTNLESKVSALDHSGIDWKKGGDARNNNGEREKAAEDYRSAAEVYEEAAEILEREQGFEEAAKFQGKAEEARKKAKELEPGVELCYVILLVALIAMIIVARMIIQRGKPAGKIKEKPERFSRK